MDKMHQTIIKISLLLHIIILSSNGLVASFTFTLRKASNSKRIRHEVIQSFAKPNSNIDKQEELNPLTKASWYAVEAFGKVFKQQNQSNKNTPQNIDLSKPPSTYKEAVQRIKQDNDRSYFLSGTVDIEAYDVNCVFSDPFVSFDGRQRFVDNLANLGSFITNYSAKTLKFGEDEVLSEVQTKVMVKLELNLPWKPILAWPWGVRYTIDKETLLITEHKETWDIAPLEGVKQIFRKPTLKISK